MIFRGPFHSSKDDWCGAQTLKRVDATGVPEQILKNPAHESTRALLKAWLTHDAGG